MRPTNLTATIPINTALSNAMDVTEQAITAIKVPSAWTAADITFAVCDTVDGTYIPAYDASGTELILTVSTSRWVALAPDATRSFNFVKLRSGTVGSPVNQLAARALVVVVEELAGA